MDSKSLTIFGIALAAILAMGTSSLAMDTVFADEVKQKIEQENDCEDVGNGELPLNVCNNSASQTINIGNVLPP